MWNMHDEFFIQCTDFNVKIFNPILLCIYIKNQGTFLIWKVYLSSFYTIYTIYTIFFYLYATLEKFKSIQVTKLILYNIKTGVKTTHIKRHVIPEWYLST